MALESVQLQPPGNSPPTPPPHWYRLRFRKGGDLRLVSHIDLLHIFERLMRRAEIPFGRTRGFHPKPNLIFAQALALGVAGLNEVADVELHAPLAPAELLDRFNRHAPAGLQFLEVRPLDKKRSVQVRRAFYRLSFADLPEGPETRIESAPQRCAEFLVRDRCVVERLRPQRRLVNIRPYVCELQADADALTMILWITPDGAARPEEVVKAVGLGPLLEAGAVLERTHLELMDDLPEEERWLPAIPRLVDAQLEREAILVAAAAEPKRVAAAEEALVESPMSYET